MKYSKLAYETVIHLDAEIASAVNIDMFKHGRWIMQEARLTGWLAGYQQVKQDRKLWVGVIIKSQMKTSPHHLLIAQVHSGCHVYAPS
jgi:hypothetical protein